MSPRFSGPQHPGAMKDHRARKRAEAQARSPRYDKSGWLPLGPMTVTNTSGHPIIFKRMAEVAAALEAPLSALGNAFRLLGKSAPTAVEQTQKDFALAPYGDHVSTEPLKGPSGTMEFHIGAVLTITDGKVVAPGTLDDIYAILNWMTGDNLFTHQLGRAADECKPALAEQFPQLAAEVVPEGLDTMGKVMAYLEGLYPKYGETVFVAHLDPEERTSIDPVDEAIMRFPNAVVVEVAEPPEADQ